MSDTITSSGDYCKRGDMYYVTREDKNRPAIIVSNDMNNQYSPYVEIVYLTTQIKKPLPTHVEIMCKTWSTAQCENITTIAKDQLGTYINTCTDKEMEQIDRAILASLGIKIPDIDAKVTAENAELKTELSVMKKIYTELLDRIIEGKGG